MVDLRAVMRALPCQRCGVGPGGWCQASSGYSATVFHAARRRAATALTAAEQAELVAREAAARADRIAAMDNNLTAEQQAVRDASAAWARILEETR